MVAVTYRSLYQQSRMTSPVVNESEAECIALEQVDTNLDKEKSFQEPEYTQDELKKVIRKLDFYLLPLCFVLYTFSVLDVRCPKIPSCEEDPQG